MHTLDLKPYCVDQPAAMLSRKPQLSPSVPQTPIQLLAVQIQQTQRCLPLLENLFLPQSQCHPNGHCQDSSSSSPSKQQDELALTQWDGLCTSSRGGLFWKALFAHM